MKKIAVCFIMIFFFSGFFTQACVSKEIEVKRNLELIRLSDPVNNSLKDSTGASGSAFSWTRIADMPGPLSGSSAQMINGDFYISGGKETPTYVSKKMYIYQSSTNLWHSGPSLNSQTYAHGSGVIEYNGSKEFYIVGGYTGYTPSSRVERYTDSDWSSPGDGTWTTVAPISPGRGLEIMCAVLNNELYAIGGGGNYGTVFKTVQKYNRATNTWETKEQLPIGLKSGFTAVHGGKIYVFGGFDETTLLTKTLIYDPVSDSWDYGADVPNKRWLGVGSTIGDKIYLVAQVSGGTNKKIIDVYDPASDSWSTIEDYPGGNCADPTVAGTESKIYVMGDGYDLSTRFECWAGEVSTANQSPSELALIDTVGYFRATLTGSSKDVAMVTIKNSGGESADITGFTSSNTAFSLAVQSFPQSVEPDSSITFPVRFTASAEGSVTGELTFTTTDPEHSSLVFCVTGTGSIPNAGTLSFADYVVDGQDGVDGLGRVYDITVSPDGRHIYTSSEYDNAITVFSRNINTGALDFVETIKDGENGIDGLACADGVTVSPDGAHVFACGYEDNSLVVFSRDNISGGLTFVEKHRDGVNGINGLAGTRFTAVSPDGAHVYVTGGADHALSVFSRNRITGSLTYLEMHKDGVNGLDGLSGAYDVKVSNDGEHVYTTGMVDNAIAVFKRDNSTGRLVQIEVVRDGVGGMDGIAWVRKIFISPEGTHIYATGANDNALAVLNRNIATGKLTFLEKHQDGAGGIDGLNNPIEVEVSPDGRTVIASSAGDGSITVFERNTVTGSLSFVKMIKNGTDGVIGVELVQNTIISPDNNFIYCAGASESIVSVFRINETVNDSAIIVKLLDSNNSGIRGSIVKYYDGGWLQADTTDDDGICRINYNGDKTKLSFKMTYAGYTQQKSNMDISEEIVFQTLPMKVKLIDSNGAGLNGGTVKYYASGWKTFAATDSTGSTPSVELLPGKYSFKIAFAGYTQQKSNIDISITNPLEYQTLPIVVKLKDSGGQGLQNGLVKYYASGWKTFAETDSSGNTPSVELLPGKYSFKMTFAGYTLQKSNIDISIINPLEYRTEPMVAGLFSSDSTGLAGGVVKYYASGWKPFGTTGSTGYSDIFELLPGKYSFKMTYAGSTEQKSNINILETNPLLFNTVAVEEPVSGPFTVRLEDSHGSGLAGGIVKYYASGWKDFGITGEDGNVSGVELLPGKYSFKMTYGGYTQQKSNIDISVSNPLVYNTAPMTVSLLSSDSTGLEGGIVKYYASGWKDFASTDSTGRTPSIELLPGKYSFKMTHAGYTLQKSSIDISIVNPLEYRTEPMVAGLFSSDSSGLAGGVVKYYASGWKPFGTTGSSGYTDIFELLPGKYSFKMTYAGYTQQKSNINIASVNPVIYQTLPMVVKLVSSNDKGIQGGTVNYYASGWKTFETTGTSGSTPPIELLPGKYSFKLTWAGFTQMKSNIDISATNPLEYQTIPMVVKLTDAIDSGLQNGSVQYYASGWKSFGSTDSDGNTPSVDLLPGKYSFKMYYTDAMLQKSNIDISAVNPLAYVYSDGILLKSSELRSNNSNIVEKFELLNNYPNLFNPVTSIRYSIPELSFVSLSVYNSSGQKIRTLVNEVKPIGRYEINWNGRNESGRTVSSGTYFYRIRAGEYSAFRKMILLK